MLKYTHGKWSWDYAINNKPCIIIDDGSGNEVTSLQVGDMELITHSVPMYELLWRVADSNQPHENVALMARILLLLRDMNVEAPEGISPELIAQVQELRKERKSCALIHTQK